MVILQLCNKYPYPPNDGGTKAIVAHTDGFLAAGHRVIILAMNTCKHSGKKDTEKKTNINLDIIAVDVDTRLHIFGILKNLFFSSFPYNAARFISPKYEAALMAVLTSRQVDIIQLEGLYLMPYIQLLRKYSSAKIVLRAHNVEYLLWEQRAAAEKNILKKIYLRILAKRMKKFEQQCINTYDLLVPISNPDYDRYVKMGNNKPTHVCPFGYTVPAKKNTVTSKCIRLFFLGALDWQPNIDGLLWFINSVWPNVVAANPEIQLQVAGRNACKEIINACRRNNVEFLGQIPEVDTLYASNDVMVVPLFSGSGMRVKIIEAMAHGKVVISTTKGAEGIDCINKEHILLAGSVEEFITTILSLAGDFQLYKKISENAAAMVREKFDNFTLCSALLEFYHLQGS